MKKIFIYFCAFVSAYLAPIAIIYLLSNKMPDGVEMAYLLGKYSLSAVIAFLITTVFTKKNKAVSPVWFFINLNIIGLCAVFLHHA